MIGRSGSSACSVRCESQALRALSSRTVVPRYSPLASPYCGMVVSSLDRTLRRSAVHLPLDLLPAVDDGQHRVGLLGREHRHDADDPHVGEALDAVQVLGEAEQSHLDAGRIAAGFLYHFMKLGQRLGDVAAPGGGDPAVTITN